MKNEIADAIHEILKTDIPFFDQLQGGNEGGIQQRLFCELSKNSPLYKMELELNIKGKGKPRIDIAKIRDIKLAAGEITNIDACIEMKHFGLNQGRPLINEYIKDAYKRLKQRMGNIYLIGMVTFIRNIPQQQYPTNYSWINNYVYKHKDLSFALNNCKNTYKRYSQIDTLHNEFKKYFDEKTILIKSNRTVDNIEIEMNFIIVKVLKYNTPTSLYNFAVENHIKL